MAFQAIAWAWKVPLADPVERCVLLWVAGRCAPDDWQLDRPFVDLISEFAGVAPDAVIRALWGLHEKGLIRFVEDAHLYVHAPQAQPEHVGNDEYEFPVNRTALSYEIKARVLRAYDGRCFACGSKQNPHVDHIIPRARGGTNDFANLQVLCAPCNTRKRDKAGWVPE